MNDAIRMVKKSKQAIIINAVIVKGVIQWPTWHAGSIGFFIVPFSNVSHTAI